MRSEDVFETLGKVITYYVHCIDVTKQEKRKGCPTRVVYYIHPKEKETGF